MKTISSDIETNKYHVLGVKQKKHNKCFKTIEYTTFFLALLNNWKKKVRLKEGHKTKCDDIDKKLLKYIALNKIELAFMMIKKLKIVSQI